MRNGNRRKFPAAVFWLFLGFVNPGIASGIGVEFVQIYLKFGEARVTGYIDYFCSGQCADSVIQPLIVYGASAAPRLDGQRDKDLSNKTRFAIDIAAPEVSRKRSPLLFTVTGLRQNEPFDLGIFIDQGQNLDLDYLAPSKSLPASRSSGSTLQTQAFFKDFSQDSIQVALTPRDSTVVLELVKSVVNFGVPLVTAIIVLMITTWVNRYLSVRRVQQTEIQVLDTIRNKIDKNPADLKPRHELIAYIDSMKLKPEYGGFSASFTDPLDAISLLGIVDDVSKYGRELGRITPGVKTSWIFFALR